jgi:hypothetical protein
MACNACRLGFELWVQRGLGDAVMWPRELFPLPLNSLGVIPGRAEGASPESIITSGGYGFRAPSLRTKSAIADLSTL